MLCARGERLLMMDADGATRVSDLEMLEERLAALVGGGQQQQPAGGGDDSGALAFVLGSRAHMQQEATAKRTWVRGGGGGGRGWGRLRRSAGRLGADTQPRRPPCLPLPPMRRFATSSCTASTSS